MILLVFKLSRAVYMDALSDQCSFSMPSGLICIHHPFLTSIPEHFVYCCIRTHNPSLRYV